jgi:hypothetical protein
MSVQFSFDNNENAIYLVSPSGGLYPLGITDDGTVGIINGSGVVQPLDYVSISGDTMTGNLNAPAIYATTLSGNHIGTSSGVIFTDPKFGENVIFSGTSTNLDTLVFDKPSDTFMIAGIPVNERSKMRATVSSGTNVITISGLSPWNYYLRDRRYTQSAPIVLSGTNADGLWYCYINSSNTPVLSNMVPYTIQAGDVILFNYLWDATNSKPISLGEERHTAGRDIYAQARFHAGGALLESGFNMVVMNSMDNTSDNLAALSDSYLRSQIRVTDGVFWDDDLKETVSHNDNPSYDWAMNFQQFLGFSELSTSGTSNSLVVFSSPHTLQDGQRITAMQGNSTTAIRGSALISGTTTSTTFNLYSNITGLTNGDKIVVGSKIPVFYLENGQWRKFDETDFPYYQDGSFLQYNTGASSLANVTNGHYIAMWLCVTNNIEAPVIVLMGQSQSVSTKFTNAINEPFTEFSSMNLGSLPFAEVVVFGRLIYEGDSGFTNKARLREVLNVSLDIKQNTVSANNDHNSLSNRDVANSHPASAISVDTGILGSGILTVDDSDVQTALNDLSIKAVSISGSTILGNLNFSGNASITSSPSGTIDIGTLAAPFGTVYASGLIVDGNRIYPTDISPENLVRVSKDLSAQFTSISGAIASISGASSLNPYAVIVEPGVYTEDSIAMKSYVSVYGRGKEECVLQPNNPSNNIIIGADNSSIKGFKFIGATGANASVIYYSSSGTQNNSVFFVEDCQFGSNYNLMHSFGPSSGSNCQIMCNNLIYGGDCTFTEGFIADGSGTGIGRITLRDSAPAYGGIPSFSVFAKAKGSGSQIVANGLQVVKNGAKQGVGFWAEDGAVLRLTSVNLRNLGSGIYVPNSGIAPAIFATAMNFEICSNDISVEHSGTTGNVNATTTYNKVSIPDSAPLYVYSKDSHKITVSKKGGDFASIADACNAVSTLSSNENPYTIDIGPGIFYEPQITVPSYTYLKGSTISASIIVPTGSNDGIIMSNSTEASFLTVQDVPSTYYAFDFTGCGDYAQLHKVSIYNSNGFKLNTITGNDTVYAEYVDINGPYTNAVNITSASGCSAYVNFENFYCFQYSSPSGTTDVYVSGPGAVAELKSCGFNGNGSGTAFYIGNEAGLYKNALTVNGYEYGLYVDDTGSNPNIGPILNVSNIISTNSVAYDYYIKHAYASGVIAAIAEKELIYVNPSNNLISWNIQDPTGEIILGGDLYLGKQFDKVQYMSPLIANTATMGVVNGGALSAGSGLNIDIASGYGYLDTDVTDWTKTQYVSWTGQSLLLPASSDVYVYIKPDASAAYSVSSIFGDVSKILLGRVVTRGDAVDYVESVPTNASHMSNYLDEAFKDAFGPIVAQGLLASATSGLKVGVSDGEYYFGAKKIESTSIPSYHADFYHVSGNWIASFNSSGTFSNTQYDSPITSGLSNLTSGYYAKHSLYLDGLTPLLYMVYAQAEYSGLSACEIANSPTPSSTFKDAIVHIADVIVQQGSGTLISVIDTRPLVSFRQSVSSASSNNNHSTLLNLNSDDHKQYLLINGDRAMTGNLNMGTNSITNVNLIKGIDITGHSSRHLPNGADALTVDVPVSVSILSNDAGNYNSFSRADHRHQMPSGSASSDGYISMGDWSNFNSKQPAGNYLVSGTTTTSIIPEGSNLYFTTDRVDNHLSGTSPISYVSGTISISSGSSTQNGYISSYDWSRFNGVSNASGNFIQNTGGTINGTLNVSTLSGTVISGLNIYDSGNRVITSVNSQSGPTVTLTTANISEGINLYYLDSRARQAISGTSPIVYSTGTGVISIQSGSSTQNGYISSGDWVTFNSKQSSGNYLISGISTTDSIVEGTGNLFFTNTRVDAHISGSSPIIYSSGLISITSGSSTRNGYISSGDWITFNSKQAAGNYLISGVSNTDAIVEGTGNLFFTNARARAVVSGTSPILVSNGLVSIQSGSSTQNGYISSGDWVTFNNKQNAGNYLVSGVSTTDAIVEGTGNLFFTNTRVDAHISGSSPISYSNGFISIASGSSTQNGYISSGDWITFNNKQDAGNYLISGISTTDSIVEGTGNLFFTNDRARAVVSGTSPISVINGLVSIASGSSTQNGYISSGDWVTFNSKQAAGNYVVSGSNAYLDIVYANVISGTTISGGSILLGGNSVISSGTSSGNGLAIFNSKASNNLVFNTVSGIGGVSIVSSNGVLTFSGSNTSSSSISVPSTTTNTAITLWSGTTGAGLLNSSIIVSNNGQTLNALVISGTTISGDNFYITDGGGYYGPSGSFSVGSQNLPAIDVDAIEICATRISGLYAGNNISLATTIVPITSGTLSLGTTPLPFSSISASIVSGNAIRLGGNDVIVSGTSSGTGFSIFNSKNNNNLIFNTISGLGTVSVTSNNGLISVSGVGMGTVKRAFTFSMDNGGSLLASGVQGFMEIPIACTVNQWSLVANVSGNLSLDVRRVNYNNWNTLTAGSVSTNSIVAADKPSLSNVSKNRNTTVTTWSGIAANDELIFHIDAAPTNISKAVLTLLVTPA